MTLWLALTPFLLALVFPGYWVADMLDSCPLKASVAISHFCSQGFCKEKEPRRIAVAEQGAFEVEALQEHC